MSDAPTMELKDMSQPAAPPEPQEPAPATTVQAPITKDSARAALESIAHPETDLLLTNASQLYLDAGDSRVMLTALASQTTDTPLGSEFRRDTLDMIGLTNLPGFEDLKNQVAKMGLPKKDPSTSQFAAFIDRYNSTHPGSEVSAELTNAIKTGQIESAPIVAQAIRENSALSESLWTEMVGKDKPKPELTHANGLLGAAGLEANDANRVKAEKMFAPLKVKKDISLGDLMPTLLGGAMLLSFISQLAMTDSGQQSQGH